MKRHLLILFAVLAIAFFLVAAIIRTPPDDATGQPHLLYPTMNQGGEASRHDGLLLIGWGYGVSQLLFFVALVSIGIKARRPIALLLFTLLYVLAFSLLFVAYARGPEPSDWIFGFPNATGMLIVVLAVPLLLVAVHSICFRRWVYDDEDARKFESIKARDWRAGAEGDG